MGVPNMSDIIITGLNLHQHILFGRWTKKKKKTKVKRYTYSHK